ncbi:hypothetical protein [Cupriavidus necator]|uniref:hypothetical protein n=1 Tax=Cupriavidus necator TaxID=106590 RepID=UPI001D026474|nr:hypothetical protein [Cupriavidus necator]
MPALAAAPARGVVAAMLLLAGVVPAGAEIVMDGLAQSCATVRDSFRDMPQCKD